MYTHTSLHGSYFASCARTRCELRARAPFKRRTFSVFLIGLSVSQFSHALCILFCWFVCFAGATQEADLEIEVVPHLILDVQPCCKRLVHELTLVTFI